MSEERELSKAEAEFERLSTVNTYGSFVLSDGLRRTSDQSVIPSEGYRQETYDDPRGIKVPVLIAAVTREKIMDLFMRLIDLTGEMPHVVLETSHGRPTGSHLNIEAPAIDLPVFKSKVWDYEDLIVNDGCTGIAVVDHDTPFEVQLDEHKLIHVYGDDLTAAEEILREHGIPLRNDMKLMIEGEHGHISSPLFREEFESLRAEMGADDVRGMELQEAWGGDIDGDKWKNETTSADIDDDRDIIRKMGEAERQVQKEQDRKKLIYWTELEEDVVIKPVADGFAFFGMEVIGDLGDSLLLWQWHGPNSYTPHLLSKKALPAWTKKWESKKGKVREWTDSARAWFDRVSLPSFESQLEEAKERAENADEMPGEPKTRKWMDIEERRGYALSVAADLVNQEVHPAKSARMINGMEMIGESEAYVILWKLEPGADFAMCCMMKTHLTVRGRTKMILGNAWGSVKKWFGQA